MGFCARHPFRRLAPFVASIRHIAPTAVVCLIVEEVSAETIDQLRAHDIIVERSSQAGQSRMPPLASRYFSYQDFLIRHGAAYDRVMLTDPASVVCQADPFAQPLPAELVYSSAGRRIGDVQWLCDAITQTYGDAVAANIRDCRAASARATIGTSQGMQRYLSAMTRELGGRTLVTGAADEAVHNYVAHMRTLSGAWLDPDDRFAAVANAVPDHRLAVGDAGVLIDGSLTPVISHWSGNPRVRQHVASAPQFQLTERARGPLPAPANAVVAFYQRQRDEAWLRLFPGSLRCVSETTSIHCVGDFNEDEVAILSGYNCNVYRAPATEPEIADNVAHFFLSQVLDKLAADPATQPDQVLMLDSLRAMFPRDPFLTKTIGLSVFNEGPMRIGESDYNRARLGFFLPLDDTWLARPIVSSCALRGKLDIVRDFYRHLIGELAERQDLLSIPKVVQGAINKLSHGGTLGFPVIAHPNAAEVHFDFWPTPLAVDTRHGVRIGGSVPGVVLADNPDTPLMRKLRLDLGLLET